MNKRGEFGLDELKNILLVLGVIVVLALLIYLFMRRGEGLLGKNVTSALFRRG